MASSESSRRFFAGLSRVMAPLVRRGLVPPTRVGGCLCLLRVRGRRSGRPREVVLDYARSPDGAIWLLAGWGNATRWYQNVLANPEVEITIGRRTRPGTARLVTDPAERVRAVRAVLLSSGVAGRMVGVDPAADSDERLATVFEAIPVVAVRAD